MSEGDFDTAKNAYESMRSAGSRGAMTAQLGFADTAIFDGDFATARTAIEEGIELAEEAGSQYFLATMRIAEAEIILRENAGVDDVSEALAGALGTSGGLSREVPAALMYIEIGDNDAAKAIADKLVGSIQPQSRAYGNLINGMLALAGDNTVGAVEALTAGTELADLWLLRFYRGIAYLEAGYAAEALDELTLCETRSGEASAVFLDDLPTWRYMATLPYWQGRAQQDLGMTKAAKQNFTAFAARRTDGDALGDDARQRMQQ
jgi:tetratricopeptide (TPR) repeat protein